MEEAPREGEAYDALHCRVPLYFTFTANKEETLEMRKRFLSDYKEASGREKREVWKMVTGDLGVDEEYELLLWVKEESSKPEEGLIWKFKNIAYLEEI